MNYSLKILILTFFLNCTVGLLTTNFAQAFTLNFNNQTVINDNEMINPKINLDANLLDALASQGVGSNDGDTQIDSKLTGHIGDLFSPIGIDISDPNLDETIQNANSIGLFNIGCVSTICTSRELDLGMRNEFDTTSQDILLINPSRGGILKLDFDQENNSVLESVAVVEDVEVAITITFTDSTNQNIVIDFGNVTNSTTGVVLLNNSEFSEIDSAVGIAGGSSQSNIDRIEADFNRSKNYQKVNLCGDFKRSCRNSF